MPVSIDGVADTLKLIRKFDPALNKAMNKEIKAAMIPIRDTARSYVAEPYPNYLRNWAKPGKGRFPEYNASVIRQGIIYRQGATKGNAQGIANVYYVANTSGPGGIYEIAGTVHPDGRPTHHEVKSRHKFNKRTYIVQTKHDSNSNNPDAGRQFIRGLGPIYGSGKSHRGRLIYKAWYKDNGKAYLAVIRAIENTTKSFNQKSFDLAA
jgi:hypothetical protein